MLIYTDLHPSVCFMSFWLMASPLKIETFWWSLCDMNYKQPVSPDTHWNVVWLDNNANEWSVCSELCVCINKTIVTKNSWKHFLAVIQNMKLREDLFWRLLCTVTSFSSLPDCCVSDFLFLQKRVISSFQFIARVGLEHRGWLSDKGWHLPPVQSFRLQCFD